jgi:hypothetical protein
MFWPFGKENNEELHTPDYTQILQITLELEKNGYGAWPRRLDVNDKKCPSVEFFW